MAEINHRVGIAGDSAEIYQLLTTDEGLSKWWTTDTEGAGPVGSIIHFRFGGDGPRFKVEELVPNKLVRWSHSGDLPKAWMGTDVFFRLTTDADQVVVRFIHGNWQEASDFMAHCSTKWAVFLLGMKDMVETGIGRPYPNDAHIDHD